MSLVATRNEALLTELQATPAPAQGTAWGYFRSLVTTGLPLCICDVVVVLGVAAAVSEWLVHPIWGSEPVTRLLLLVALAFTCPIMFYMYGLYPGIGMNAETELRQHSKASLMLATVYVTATTAQGMAPGTNTLVVAFSWPLWLVGLPVARRFVRMRLGQCEWWGLRTLVFGDSVSDEQVYELLKKAPNLGLRVTGYVDELHSADTLRQMAADENVHHAVVCSSDMSLKEVMRLLANGDHGFSQLTVIPSTDEPFDLGLQAIDVGNRTLGLVGQERLLLPTNRIIKRLFDVGTVAIGGLLISPVLLVIAVLVKLTSPGPILYGDVRVGRHGVRFRAWKFRTMVTNAQEVLEEYLEKHPELRDEWLRDRKLKDDPRITRVGRVLRQCSLDELPQLWNVLVGQMSLVGPRPILTSEVDEYGYVLPLYFKVLPGITGLWQVSGRNDTTYSQRLTLVASYVRNWSVWLDLCILAKTPVVVLRRDGAY